MSEEPKPEDVRRFRDVYKLYSPAKAFCNNMERLLFQMMMQPREFEREKEIWSDVEKSFETLINETWPKE